MVRHIEGIFPFEEPYGSISTYLCSKNQTQESSQLLEPFHSIPVHDLNQTLPKKFMGASFAPFIWLAGNLLLMYLLANQSCQGLSLTSNR